jgi:hypothetical protein
MSRVTKNSTPIQKYCKVCHDTGKSEAEYRSHFVRETRDPNSRVVCPTLLSLCECRYCFKKGHTVKYCEVLRNKDKEQVAPRAQAPKKAEEKPKGKQTNIFAILDSDCEEEDAEPKVDEVRVSFPALPIQGLTRTQPVSTNYAAALLKPATEKPATEKPATEKPATEKPDPQRPIIAVEHVKPAAVAFETKAAPWASGLAKVSTINWADCDSDSEDDEEDNSSAW